MKATISAVVLVTIALLAPASFAAGVPPAQKMAGNQGFIYDRNGTPITGARTGNCVHSRHWTASSSDPRCKPAVVPASKR